MADLPFVPIRIAVLTVSDTRTLADDKSGQTLADRIAEAGHILADRRPGPRPAHRGTGRTPLSYRPGNQSRYSGHDLLLWRCRPD